jgi:uncharacterized protein (TIGR00661 family)
MRRSMPENYPEPKRRTTGYDSAPMRILYGVVGEGMGHATRSKVVIEHLVEQGHKVKIVVSGRAYDYLKRHFDDVVEIKGLTIRYSGGAMERQASLLQNVLLSPSMLFQNAASYVDDVRHFKPKIVFSDFDSYAFFFARRFKLPIVSIDNQQIIHKCKHSSEITKGVAADYRATRAFVKAKLPGCDHYLITSFFTPPIRPKFEDRVTLVPPILRREILEAEPTRGGHVLVYQTSTSDKALLAELNRLRDRSFVVYGLRRDAVQGNCVLRNFSEQAFVKDLASARAVVTNGGLSLIHESIYLKKPILSVPVRHQFEQEMNARYLEQYDYGLAAPRTDADVLDAFLRQEHRYVRALRHHHQKGNEVLFRKVDKLIDDLT